jgi:hypothetical protein
MLVAVNNVETVTHQNQICALKLSVVLQLRRPRELPALHAAVKTIQADVVLERGNQCQFVSQQNAFGTKPRSCKAACACA